MLNVEIASHSNVVCLISNDYLSWLWHRRIAHIHIYQLNKLVFKELVRGLLKLKFEKDGLCNACQNGEQNMLSLVASKSYWIVPINQIPKVLILTKYKFYDLTFHA